MTVRLLPASLLVVALIVACGGGGDQHSVVGVIIDVKATSLTQVDTFTLQDTRGEKLVFHVAPDAARDPQEGFVASHLRTHSLAAEKVRVSYRTAKGELLAFKLEHCNAASPPC